MGYAIQTDVEGEFKDILFTSTTLVTDGDITRFIAEASALINGYVSARYVVPITTDADAVALMRLYCVTLVADRVKKILENKQATNTAGNQDVRGGYSTKDVLKALKDISTGDLNLTGAVLVANGGQGGVFSSTTGRCPTFQRDKTQW